VHQVGTPQDVYAWPATLFVAAFVGAMNVIPDVAIGSEGQVALGAERPRLAALAGRGRVTLAIRPEDVVLGRRPPDAPAISLVGAVTKVTFAGREAYYRMDAGEKLEILAHVHRPHDRPLAAVGERLDLALPVGRMHAFGADDGRRIELRP
jgi:ABC-type Fe3+/spermidine/putrescine transport system ATPase subunit